MEFPSIDYSTGIQSKGAGSVEGTHDKIPAYEIRNELLLLTHATLFL